MSCLRIFKRMVLKVRIDTPEYSGQNIDVQNEGSAFAILETPLVSNLDKHRWLMTEKSHPDK